MKPRTPYLYDALVFLGCALLLAIKALDAHTFGMITVALVGVRVGVSAGKRAIFADFESGRLRIGSASDRPPPPSDPGGSARGGSSSSSEPPKLPPTSAALAIVGAVRSTGVAGAATVLVVLVLLALFGFGGGAALAGR